MRETRRELARADTEKLQRVVAMIDTLADRGEADSLIAPLRPLLAQLRVRRPRGLSRLLFAPLGPVLVSAPGWVRGGPSVPRTVLPSFAACVRTDLGAEAQAMEHRLITSTVHEDELARAIGPGLWARAASVLAASDVPEDWAARTGLKARDHAVLTHIVALILRHAPAIEAMLQADPLGESKGRADPALGGVLDAILADPEAARVTSLAAVLVVLLTRLPAADQVLEAVQARETDANRATLRRAAETALAFALDRLHGDAGLPSDIATASHELARQAAMLTDLARWAEHGTPGKRQAITEARRALDAACRARFHAAIGAQLVPPTAEEASPASPTAPAIAPCFAPPAVVAALEQSARDLRRFALAARRIGGAAHYDQLLREAAARLTGTGVATLTRADRARLMELLVGPEEALRLWREGAAACAQGPADAGDVGSTADSPSARRRARPAPISSAPADGRSSS